MLHIGSLHLTHHQVCLRLHKNVRFTLYFYMMVAFLIILVETLKLVISNNNELTNCSVIYSRYIKCIISQIIIDQSGQRWLNYCVFMLTNFPTFNNKST